MVLYGMEGGHTIAFVPLPCPSRLQTNHIQQVKYSERFLKYKYLGLFLGLPFVTIHRWLQNYILLTQISHIEFYSQSK